MYSKGCFRFYFRCTWKGKKCGPEDFTTQFTDYGKCYTFNAKKNGKHDKILRTGLCIFLNGAGITLTGGMGSIHDNLKNLQMLYFPI